MRLLYLGIITLTIFSRTNLPPGYYAYMYLRKGTLTPYYIGKGKGGRAWDHKSHNVKVPIDQERIIIIDYNLTETGAFLFERMYIKCYGRVDLGTGILRNITDGGDGVAGYKHTEVTLEKIRASSKNKILTAEHRAKISIAHKGVPKNYTVWNKGLKMSTPSSKKGKPGRKGISHTDEAKQKISLSNKGKRKGMIPWNKGLTMSAPSPKKGKPSPLKGSTQSSETIKKRLATIERKKLAGWVRSDKG